MRKERDVITHNLSSARANSVLADDIDGSHLIKRTFQSHVDGIEDWYALMPPSTSGRLDNTLVVYLHGMGSSFIEPFIYPAGETISHALISKYANVCLLSCNYRKETSWGNDAALADITQNIRHIVNQYPFKRIVLMGTSMGGYSVLNYAAVAPNDIKEKLCGIVSVEGAGDLKELSTISQNASVPAAIIASMGGTPEQQPANYEKRNFFQNLSGLPKTVRIAVVSAKEDTIVPAELQRKLVQTLEGEHYAVKLFEVEGRHGVPPAPIYLQGLEFALGAG